MIFRRLKAHLEKENWVAVAIDFCIVVLGVFIGIQFGNWNDSRLNNEKRELIMQRMLNQSEEATRYYKNIFELLAEHNDARLYAIEILQSGNWSEADQDRLTIGATTMGLFPSPSAPRSSLDEFLRSGFYSEVESDRLREAIDQYTSERVFLEGQTDYFRQGWDFLEYDGISRRLDMESTRQTATEIDPQSLAADPRFIDAIFRSHNLGRGIAGFWFDTWIASHALCEALAEELSGDCEAPAPDMDLEQ